MTNDSFSHATEQKARQSLLSVRTHDDQLRAPILRRLDIHFADVALSYFGRNLEA
jgi:hypothetical protein